MSTEIRATLPTTDQRWLRSTRLLDFGDPPIVRLLDSRGWRELREYERIKAVHDFLRDAVPFGYNASDDVSASSVLRDGCGQCNTKGTLLMALLRATDVPCRLHGFTIDKELQKGTIPAWLHRLSPPEIITARALRPGGDLRFYEHVVSNRPSKARVRRALDATIYPTLEGVCHCARHARDGPGAGFFQIDREERIAFKPSPITPSIPHILGVARRA